MRKLTALTVALSLSAAGQAFAGEHHVSVGAKASALASASPAARSAAIDKARLKVGATAGSDRPTAAEAKAQVSEQVRSDARALANAEGGISLSNTAERASQEATEIKQTEREIELIVH